MIIDFIKPKSLDEAYEALAKYGESAVIINGGTDVVPSIVHDVSREEKVLIYINELPELKVLYEENGKLHIGGSVSYKEIIDSSLCRGYESLVQSAKEIGSPPIQNIATPAGNIVTSSPAGDCNVALIALDAEVILGSSKGSRQIMVKDIFFAPYKPKIQSDELIKEIIIPCPGVNSSSAFIKFGRRKAQDKSRVSCAVSTTIENNVIKDVRIALGAVNPIPIRVYSLEKLIIDCSLNESIKTLESYYPNEATPRKQYKRLIINPIIRDTFRKACKALEGVASDG